MNLNDLLQGLDLNTLLPVALCCIGILLFGGVIGFVVQFLGFGVQIIGTLLDVVMSIISGGPIAWCGCLVMLFGCAGCGFITLLLASVLPNCGTPNQVNLCRLFGF